jgi:hypothetical protein
MRYARVGIDSDPIFSLGRAVAAGVSGSSTGSWVLLLGRGGQVVAGGPQAVLRSPSELSCHGQSLGTCKTSGRADLARRAGTAISCLRTVAVWPWRATPIRGRRHGRG